MFGSKSAESAVFAEPSVDRMSPEISETIDPSLQSVLESAGDCKIYKVGCTSCTNLIATGKMSDAEDWGFAAGIFSVDLDILSVDHRLVYDLLNLLQKHWHAHGFG